MALFITRYFHAVRFPNHSLYHSAPIWSTPSHDVITDGFCVGGPLVFRNKRYDFVCIIFMKFQNFHKNFEFTCTLVPCCTPSVLWCSCWFKVIQGGLTLCTPFCSLDIDVFLDLQFRIPFSLRFQTDQSRFIPRRYNSRKNVFWRRFW